ncbi:MAG: NAD(P)H-hydrate epimerase, partial [Acidimicrobiales bacterium]
MKPVLTRAEMADVDAAAARVESFEAIVERAGTAVERTALAMLGGAYGRRVVVVAGRGHNGDDGRVAARRLRRRGAHVLEMSPDGGNLPACDLVVDAAFGTGFRGHYSAPSVPPLPTGTRAGQALVLAVDVPSGVDADTGEACPGAVRADCSVTFGAHKPGLVLGDGPEHAGRVVLDHLGLPVEESQTRTWM